MTVTTTDPQAWARLASALRAAREARQWTQAELADRAKVSARAVQDAERGRPPRLRMPYTLTPIARELGWPAGTVDTILAGGAAPGWENAATRSGVDRRVLEAVITSAITRAVDNATSIEIRRAVALALEELARAGLVAADE